MRLNWRGIIFDRDGTLFDSLPVILKAFEYGIELFTEKRPTAEEWFAAFGPAEPEVMGKFISSDHKPEAFRRFYDYYREHFEEVRLFPGIAGLLFRLKAAGAGLMLFTGGGKVSTRFCLEQAGIDHVFDALICGEDVACPKPDPEGVLKLMQIQGLTSGETVVVGDAPADILAAKAAGVSSILVRFGEHGQSGDSSVRPDYFCLSVRELELLLMTEDAL